MSKDSNLLKEANIKRNKTCASKKLNAHKNSKIK